MINCLKLFKTSIGLFLCLLCSHPILQAQSQDIRAIAAKHGIPGIQLLQVRKGKVIQQQVYGLKKQGEQDLINDSTAFQAASLTKVVAAYTFFRLMDKGLLHLDTPLYHYYAYDRLHTTPNKELITARMVLTHRTGLLNWEGDVPSATWRSTPLTLQFIPGAAYSYSGEGFYFLQETMEHVTGKSFQQLVEEEVLIPLGMKHSAIVWKDSLEKNAAYGHYEVNKPRRLGKYMKSNAAYTLYTTAHDYTRFIQEALFKGKGLKSKTHRLMVSKASEAQRDLTPSLDDSYVPCALGFRIQKNEVGTAYWHTGSNPGFRCFFIAYPKTKESLVVFMNADTALPAMHDFLHTYIDKKQTFWAYNWRQGELD